MPDQARCYCGQRTLDDPEQTLRGGVLVHGEVACLWTPTRLVTAPARVLTPQDDAREA